MTEPYHEPDTHVPAVDRRHYDAQIRALREDFSALRSETTTFRIETTGAIASIRERQQGQDEHFARMEEAMIEVKKSVQEGNTVLFAHIKQENEDRVAFLTKINVMLWSAVITAASAAGALLFYIVQSAGK